MTLLYKLFKIIFFLPVAFANEGIIETMTGLFYKLFKKLFFKRIVEDIERACNNILVMKKDLPEVATTKDDIYCEQYWQDFIKELKK